ncbi:MAG TPA: hypothetical protein V6D48_24105 [Oculatellaceae cyanobacterium]
MAASREWAFVRSWLRRVYNKKVYEYFKDLDSNDDPDINTGRSATKAACLIGANDSQNIALIKMYNFNSVVREIDREPIYGIPCTTFHRKVKFYPQIVLHFKESKEDAQRNNRRPIGAEHSFRFHQKSISEAEVKELARKIKQEFATPPVKFKKGEIKISYKDEENDSEFILAVDDEAEAKKIITKILSIQGEKPNWDYLTNSESGRNFKAKKTEHILGEVVELPQRRPIGHVEFTHAELKVRGLIPDKVLVDVTLTYPNALLYV